MEGAPDDLLDELRTLAGLTSVAKMAEGAVRIHVVSRDATSVVLQRLVAAGVQTIHTSLPSLEEVYVHVFGARGSRV